MAGRCLLLLGEESRQGQWDGTVVSLSTGQQKTFCLTRMRRALGVLADGVGARLERFAVSASNGHFWLHCSGDDNDEHLKAAAVLPLPDPDAEDLSTYTPTAKWHTHTCTIPSMRM